MSRPATSCPGDKVEMAKEAALGEVDDEVNGRVEPGKMGIGEPQEVESKLDKKRRIRSIRIVNVVAFVFSVGFSIVFTGTFPYLKQVGW